jgi:16S rRNA (uracil1498-N3)-methyltransferase
LHHRIYTTGPLREEVTITGDEFHHASRVARVREGEEVELFDGHGAAARGRVTAIGGGELRVRVEGEIPSRESTLDLRLAMSIIHLDKFELVLQKGTELGCRSFIPLVTERVELRPERYRGKMDRWEKIVMEAVKQSGRAAIPVIEPPAAFADVIGRQGTKIVFDADRAPTPLPQSLDAVTLLIGPEGGWSEDELALAERAGCLFQKLGPRRLRAETAALAAVTRISDRYDNNI